MTDASVEPSQPQPTDFDRQIDRAMQVDQFRLRRSLRNIEKAAREGKPTDRQREKLTQDLNRSVTMRRRRAATKPSCDFDFDLPILEWRAEIAETIRRHQVVVICGETGSGKSTQLPKICLDIGRGVGGLIGHTQPRRVAARTIAARLAEELKSSIGEHVGFQIRFNDTTKPNTFIKLMTDGILLAETQGDRYLDRYDTIIVDEAHERSLNIDFLIGYLKNILPKRPDLRVIITSATIDAKSFAAHFSTAGHEVPIIEVSGRTFPVEVRYRAFEPQDDNDEPPLWADQIAEAAAELCREGPGDILTFLPTERDIMEVAKRLRNRSIAGPNKLQILPLYGRLSTAEQNKVFKPTGQRRMVLATNVAESSVTVPGIRYVIDTGTARISRYSPRSKVQRLPIEAVSRASADQRKGRCGRLGPGICIRLFSEKDFVSRDQYTTPEIRRTNLAAVILRMLSLRLGAVDQFPFLDPPRTDAINDGYKTLFELGAVDAHRRLTSVGKQLSRLPIDPRIGRMILAADQENCLHEMLIIAAALEVQDVRDRPVDKQKQADEAHAKFAHDDSDFLTYLNLWDFFHGLRDKLSRSQIRRACQQNFLSFMRIREWQDVHRQLMQLAGDGGLKTSARKNDSDAIHRALLCGLLSNVAMRRDGNEYEGAGGTSFFVWPGSATFNSKPKWVVAGEAVETSRRYLRTVGRIQPNWIEPLAAHIVKRSYTDPFWSRKSGTVLAYEKVTLFGLLIVAGRRQPYAKHDPTTARHLFIEHALVGDDFDSEPKFVRHNRQLLADLQTMGDKSRATDFLVGDGVQYAFYEERLPRDVYDAASLNVWLKHASREESKRLKMTLSDLIGEPDGQDQSAFPDSLDAGSLNLEIDYRFQPGDDDDGLTISVPKEGLQQLDARRLEWLVPGRVQEKLTALIRSLPKAVRRSFIPAPDVARRAAEMMPFAEGDFLAVAAQTLSKIGGEPLAASNFKLNKLPHHLRMNVRVIDESGNPVAEGRDIDALAAEVGIEGPSGANVVSDANWDRKNIRVWDFGELPASVTIHRGDFVLEAFPMLQDDGDSVSIGLATTAAAAKAQTHAGLRRLFCLTEHHELKSQVHWLPLIDESQVFASTMRHSRDLREQLMELAAELSFLQGQPSPRDAESFEAARHRGRQKLLIAAQKLGKLIAPLLQHYHEAEVALGDVTSSKLNEAMTDMRQQLGRLTPDGFWCSTPWNWLTQYPRYFQAITARLAKLRVGGGLRDHQAMQELASYQHRFDDHVATGNVCEESRLALEEYRWMLEEYRVSLFAQQLGTSIKISPQRLDKQWAKV
ncbi:MAG: ATP-dependent RNA helicase HrpA [Pirellulaceae bacterium]|jgi:ATP-dependent helicase HrpA|nr:ATP-dependent RNA helicase HrpA [Pirellulaceae bacterium]